MDSSVTAALPGPGPSHLFSLQDDLDNEVELSLTPTGGVTPHASLSNLTFNFQTHSESQASQHRGEQELPPSSPPQLSPPDLYFNTIFSDKIIQDDNALPFDRGQADLENFEDTKSNWDCSGQPIEWTAGSVWDSYAYQLHNNDTLPWKLVAFKEDKFIVIQSRDYCAGKPVSDNEETRGTCNACSELRNSVELRRFILRASEEAKPHTPWRYLNRRQLEELLIRTKKKVRDLSLKV